MADIDKNIAKRVKTFRKKLDFSQGEVAKRLDISQGYLSDIETGKTFFSGAKLISLVSIFRLNLGWLLTGEGEMFVGQQPALGVAEIRCPYGLDMQNGDGGNEIQKIIEFILKNPEFEKFCLEIISIFEYLVTRPLEKKAFFDMMLGYRDRLNVSRSDPG